MTSEPILNLSTRVAPVKTFLLDGAEYKLFGIDHLSKDDETTVMALFARHGVLSMQLDGEANVDRGKRLAEALKATRHKLLRTLTTMPLDVVEELPEGAAAKIMEAMQDELNDGQDVPAEPDVLDDPVTA